MCVVKYLKHYVKHSFTQICSMCSISISVIINIIFTTHYCLLELFHCNFIFFSNLWIMRSLKLKFAHSLFLLKEVFNWNGFKNLNNNCVQKKTKNKKKNNISFGWSNIIFFTVYNDRLNTFENKTVINSKSWLKYSKMAENIEWIICWYQKFTFYNVFVS